MAESLKNLDEDPVDIEHSATSSSLPPRVDDNEKSNREEHTEKPQVTSLNERESYLLGDVMCAEALPQSTSLEGGDPQPQTFETDNRNHLQPRPPDTNICHQSVQTPFPGFSIMIFLLKKKIPDENKALYRLYIIPYNKYWLMEEICEESWGAEVRRLSFFINNSKMQDTHTFFLENNEQVTVAFKITNNDQQNFSGWEEGCQQFGGFEIRSQSQNRIGERGSRATFCVEYLGEEGKLCQEQGEITLTYNSNPFMRMTLLFSISN